MVDAAVAVKNVLHGFPACERRRKR